jgi:hypothetical protein
MAVLYNIFFGWDAVDIYLRKWLFCRMSQVQTFYNWCVFHRDKIITLFTMPFPIFFMAFFAVGSLPFDMLVSNIWLQYTLTILSAGLWTSLPFLLVSPLVALALYKEKWQMIVIAGAVFWIMSWYAWQIFLTL